MRPAQEVFFDSDGVRCAADMYWPDDVVGSVPCVVMAHGGSGTKRLGLPGYAQEFASHGMAVLVFDYRHFGESDGQPRQVIDVGALSTILPGDGAPRQTRGPAHAAVRVDDR